MRPSQSSVAVPASVYLAAINVSQSATSPGWLSGLETATPPVHVGAATVTVTVVDATPSLSSLASTTSVYTVPVAVPIAAAVSSAPETSPMPNSPPSLPEAIEYRTGSSSGSVADTTPTVVLAAAFCPTRNE